jgi:hypothetical protein
MNKTILLKKGYTVKITSWENDGDHHHTEEYHTEDLEFTKALVRVCRELFCSSNNGKKGLGNLCDGETTKYTDIAESYFENNPNLWEILFPDDPFEAVDEDDLYDMVTELSYDCVGASEFYLCRVCEKVEVLFTPEDLEVEIIGL